MARSTTVPVMLSGGRVTAEFRNALFAAAARSGQTVNEFVLQAAGEKLARTGAVIGGVFERGDLEFNNDNHDGAEPRSAIG